MTWNFSKITTLDFETTGLQARSDEIIEYAFLKMDNGKVVDKLCGLIKPNGQVKKIITDITGITPEMLVSQPSMSSQIKHISNFIGHDPLIAFNLPFDRSFLNVALYNGSLHQHYNLGACAMDMGMSLLGSSAKVKLGHCLHSLGITPPTTGQFHRAEFDAYGAGLIYYKFLERYANQISQNPQIITSRFSPIKKIKFG